MKKPNRPFFSSGPCAKPPTWDLSLLNNALISRSPRSELVVKRINLLIQKTRSLLKIPDDYQVGIISGSATGAMESLLWSLLGSVPVDILSFDVFGELWAHDIIQELKIPHRIFRAEYGKFTNYRQNNPDSDVVWVWNASSSGVRTPNVGFLHKNRTGLAITDITSAAFAMPIPWLHIDAAAWSWQKSMGGEAGCGMIALSPKALIRLENYTPPWPIPRCFRLNNLQTRSDIFNGITVNTISLLSVEDALFGLEYLETVDFFEKTRRNAEHVEKFVLERPFLRFVVENAECRSPSTMMFTFSDSNQANWRTIIQVAKFLEDNGAGFDVKGHAGGIPAFRIWCGPTVEEQDIRDLLPWFDKAFTMI